MDRQDMTCGTCAFWLADNAKAEHSDGSCRRYPPHRIVLPIIGARDYNVSTQFPRLADDQWCGEWRPR